MPKPEMDERRRLVSQYNKDLPIKIDIEEWANSTLGISGAEIKSKFHKAAKKHILDLKMLKFQTA